MYLSIREFSHLFTGKFENPHRIEHSFTGITSGARMRSTLINNLHPESNAFQ